MTVNQIIDREATYAMTIKEAYPELDILSARLHTSDGQFNDILVINDSLIFRFPRYEESVRDFLQEIEVLQKLQGQVTLPIPNPVYISSGTRVVGKVFMGYKILLGEPLFRGTLSAITNESILDSLAQQLASFLHELHYLSSIALGLDFPISDQIAESKKFFSNIQEHLFSFMRPDARDSVKDHFEHYFNNASLQRYEPCIIHGDFGGSNILFNEERITGVIDFSFAGLGDPAADLAAVSTFGDPFFARICKYYSPSQFMLERARFYRGTFALYEALHGFRNNDKEAFESGMEQYV